MNLNGLIRIFVLVTAITSLADTVHAQNVKITPIGAKTGEFCGPDRAMLFEDPTGVRILYDQGNTITSATDPRLGDVHGDVHVILMSHAHGDHLGAAWLNQKPGRSRGQVWQWSCRASNDTGAQHYNSRDCGRQELDRHCGQSFGQLHRSENRKRAEFDNSRLCMSNGGSWERDNRSKNITMHCGTWNRL